MAQAKVDSVTSWAVVLHDRCPRPDSICFDVILLNYRFVSMPKLVESSGDRETGWQTSRHIQKLHGLGGVGGVGLSGELKGS